MWNGTSLCVSFFPPIGFIYFFWALLGSQQNWAESSVPRKLPSMSTPPQLSHYQYHMSEWWTCNLLQLMKPALSHLYHPGSIVYIRFPSRCCRQWKITRIHCCSCPVEVGSPLGPAYSFLSPPATSSLGFWWLLYLPSDNTVHHLSMCWWPLVFLRGEIQVKLYKLLAMSMYSTMATVRVSYICLCSQVGSLPLASAGKPH